MGPTHIEEDNLLFLVYPFKCSSHPGTPSNNVSQNIWAPPDPVKVTHEVNHHTLDLCLPLISSEDVETNRIRGSHAPTDLERGRGQLFSGVANLEMEKKIKNIVMRPDVALKTLGTTTLPCRTLKPEITIWLICFLFFWFFFFFLNRISKEFCWFSFHMIQDKRLRPCQAIPNLSMKTDNNGQIKHSLYRQRRSKKFPQL